MIRPVRSTDRDEWLRMRAGLWPDESPIELGETIDAYFAGRKSLLTIVFVSDEGSERLSGFLELYVREYAEGCAGETPYVEGWFVVEQERGKGIGKQLMRAAEEWSRDNGFAELASDALIDNIDSHRAHSALGFEEVERNVHFRKTL